MNPVSYNQNSSQRLSSEKSGFIELILTRILSFVFWIVLAISVYYALAIVLARVTNFSGEFTGAPFWYVVFLPLMFLGGLQFGSYNFLAVLGGLILLQGLFAKTNYSIRVYRRSTVLAGILLLITASSIFNKTYYRPAPDLFIVYQYFLTVLAVGLLIISSALKYRKIWLIISLLILAAAIPLALPLKKTFSFSNTSSVQTMEPTYQDEHLKVYVGKYNQMYQLNEEKVIFIKENSLIRQSDNAVFYVITPDGQKHSSFRNYNASGFYDLYTVTGYLYRPQTRIDDSVNYDLVVCGGDAANCKVWYNLYKDPNWTPPPEGMPKVYYPDGRPVFE